MGVAGKKLTVAIYLMNNEELLRELSAKISTGEISRDFPAFP